MPSRGEVWMVDLGMIQKVRPALILNRPFKERLLDDCGFEWHSH